MKKFVGLFLLLSFFLSAPVHLLMEPESAAMLVYAEEVSPVRTESGTLRFTGQKQVLLEELDYLGRAQGAQIQLQEKDTPTKKREPRIKYNPVGWHNYKLHYEVNNHKKSWLMHRGHLIGYQFSGLSDEKRNLVPMTAWLNAGNYKGTDDKNPDSMLYYENRLDSWLATHPHFWLDLRVTPIYNGEELLPRQIRLQYVGLAENGEFLPIRLGGKETEGIDGVMEVVLDNVSANAQIDYATGRASQADLTPKEPVVEEVIPAEAVEAQAPAVSDEQERTVYIARDGKADVYWYSKENMPKNTRMDRVIAISESEAIQNGKRHTTKE